MRGVLRALLVLSALGLGAVVGCYTEEFLLGARCTVPDDCGADQCCAGNRCRPAPGYCDTATNQKWAYTECRSDDDCRVHGMVRCVYRDAAPTGFCADLCYGDPVNCEQRPESDSRVCLVFDGQQVCALRCCSDGCAEDSPCAGQSDCPDPCPDDMQCLADVCVPKASS